MIKISAFPISTGRWKIYINRGLVSGDSTSVKGLGTVGGTPEISAREISHVHLVWLT